MIMVRRAGSTLLSTVAQFPLCCWVSPSVVVPEAAGSAGRTVKCGTVQTRNSKYDYGNGWRSKRSTDIELQARGENEKMKVIVA